MIIILSFFFQAVFEVAQTRKIICTAGNIVGLCSLRDFFQYLFHQTDSSKKVLFTGKCEITCPSLKKNFSNSLLKEMPIDVIFNRVTNSFPLLPAPTYTHPKRNKCSQFTISTLTIFSHFVSFQWNDVILTFRSGMSVGRHRRYMKSYDSCFIASESIDWLHEELKNNPNFGPKVTR